MAQKQKTVKEIEKLATQVGIHYIAPFLYLRVTEGRRGLSALWFYRIQIDGKKKKRSLGQFPLISFKQALNAVAELEAMRLKGVNPIEEAKKQFRQARAKAREEERTGITFEKAYFMFLESKLSGPSAWKGGEEEVKRAKSVFKKHMSDLLSTPLNEITSMSLAAVLKPLASSLHPTYKKLVKRLKAFYDWSAAHGYTPLNQANPAAPAVMDYLVGRPVIEENRHQGALAPESVPAFFSMLHEHEEIMARCIELAILTGTRVKNARLMTWKELNADLSVWTLPPDRMKASSNGMHIVPLSRQAQELLQTLKAQGYSGSYVFPAVVSGVPRPFSENYPNQFIKRLIGNEIEKGNRAFLDPVQTIIQGKDVRATLHGTARATLATWATAEGIADKETIEAVLHHAQGKVAAAYFRADLMEKRRKFLQQWADFCYSDIAKK